MSKLMKSEWRDRISHWVRTLKDDFYQPLGEIQWEAFRTNEQLSLGEAKKEQFVSVKPGFTWGNTYEYCWMKGHIQLSEEANGKRIVMNLKPDGEATLFVNDKAFGTYRASWVNEPHHYIVDNVLSRCAKGDEQFDIMMEVYAGHYYPEAPTGGCATGPVLPGSYTDKLEEGKRRTLGRCTYGIWNEDAYQLFMDVDTLGRLLEVLDKTSLRAAKIAKALEQFTLIVDFEQERDARIESYKKAREALKPVLEAENGSTMPVFYAVGNAHLDLAWLWPIAETGRKTARTFAAQLRLIEEYPEYKFIQSQPAEYEMCRKLYPELFERIKAAVKKGQWIAEGAMWVEPDTNMASGEALIRQLLYGKQYYKDVFDVDSEVLWLPDTFGYTGALPQILKGCKVNYLVTQKIFWSYNEGEQFPYHYFNWEGIDGSRIVLFLPTSYTYKTNPKQLEEVWKNRSQLQDLDAFLLPFGYGDGGGGPQFEMIEAARRLQDLEGCPKVEYTSADAFVQKLEAAAPTLPVYDGELYLELHRGTLTAKQQIKKNNRMAENLLRMLELCLTRSAVATHTPADGTALRPLWNTLLVNQFHDILPGSCIAAANDRSLHDMAEMLHTGSELLRSWFAPAQNCYTVLNPLDEPCRDVFYLPQIASGFIAQEPGVTLQNVVLADGTAATAVYGLERPALGAAVLHFVPGEQPAQTSHFVYDGKTLTTPLLQVQLDELGRITSLVTRADGMQWADGPMNTLLMAEDVSAGWDGWDIDADCMMKLQPAARLTKQTVTADGPQEFRLHSRYELGTATILEQDMIFRAESTLVEWQTVLHWNEKHRVLKAAFPTNLRAKTARHEIQFGYIERPTTANDTREQAMFERCNHRYTDLSEPGRGLSIFNDCKYGISVQGGTMALTLAKGGTRPDERGDVGTYTFRYAIQPHAEGFSAKVPRRGMRFDRLPTVLAADAPSPALLTTSCRNVVVETVKPCEDAQNAMIVRLYECEGSHTAPVALHPGFAVTAAHQCDMAENAQFSVDLTNLAPFKPFEVRTVKIEY